MTDLIIENLPNNNDFYPLKNKWNLFFHKIKDNNWNLDSYKLLYSFDNIRDFWKLFRNHPKHNFGMFFLMRENISPIWEDQLNIKGGTYSFKIPSNLIENAWCELAIAVISESTLMNNKFINGISIHPKYNCYIIKIWAGAEIDNLQFNTKLKYFDTKTCIYKKNAV